MSKSPVLSFLAAQSLLARNADGSVNEQSTGEAMILALRAEFASAAARYTKIEAFLDSHFSALAAEGKMHQGIQEIAFAFAVSYPGSVFTEVVADITEFVAQSNRFVSERGRGKGVTRIK